MSDLGEYLRFLAYDGACERYDIHPVMFEVGLDQIEGRAAELRASGEVIHANAERALDVRRRIDFELDVIEQAGFPGYFLIVADLLRFCRRSGIPTGPGRGSVCGSAVAYATGITDIDPLRWGIPFERFLHLERIAMPDVDLDICQARRGEVIEYLRDKYGRDNVAQIVTFSPMQARGVVKDVCRILHVDDIYGTSNGEYGEKLAKLIPEGSGADQVKLAEFIETERGQAFLEAVEPLEVEYNGEMVSVLDTCLKLEGTRKSPSVHPAGVVIADRPLIDVAPLFKRNKDAEVQIQFDLWDAETIGLLKFDVLGLRTITVIGDAERFVRQERPDFNIKEVPLDDEATYALLAEGDTGGVFQLEGEGITAALEGVIPDRFEDIVALLALYRPGPMEQLPNYIHRKHGEEEVVYAHPALEPVLSTTYGLIVYQEQVMGIARVLAGYTAGEADQFRKAIGKKLPELIRKEIGAFTERAVANGHDPRMLELLGEQIAFFGRYGFNLGHATGYAHITYWTAYLKANHPVEFYTALLNSFVDDPGKLGMVLREVKKRGMLVLPPHVNKSGRVFTIERGETGEDAILFGLEAVRGLGETAVVDILEERDSEEKNAYRTEKVERFRPDETTSFQGSQRVAVRVPNKPRPFDGPVDFCRRLPSITVTVKQALAIAGGFGHDLEYRKRLYEAMPDLNKRAKAGKDYDLSTWEGETMSDMEAAKMERDVVGFYVTGHPLDLFGVQLEMYGAETDGTFEELPICSTIAGLVVAVRIHQSRNGEMAWVKVENGVAGMPEVTIFADLWRPIRDKVKADTVIVVRGRRENSVKYGLGFKAESVQVLDRSRPDATLVRVAITDCEDDVDMLASLTEADDGGPLWHAAIPTGDRVALFNTGRRTPMTGALAEAMREMGWRVQLDPDRGTPIRIGAAKYAVVDQTHSGDGRGGRRPIWEEPLIEYAVRTIGGKTIAEMKRTR